MSLLLIFIFNLVATTLADTTHIEIEMHSSATEHSQEHDTVKTKKTTKSEPTTEHCNEHEGCHNAHFHHYIFSSANTFAGINAISTETFTEIYSHYRPFSLDIIKPPLV